MGLTYVDATVTGPTGKSRTLDLLVDSGASYSLLPTDVWRELELKPDETLDFILADGTKIERRASECKIRLNGKERHTPVILGEVGDEPLLGVITLLRKPRPHPRPVQTHAPSDETASWLECRADLGSDDNHRKQSAQMFSGIGGKKRDATGSVDKLLFRRSSTKCRMRNHREINDRITPV